MTASAAEAWQELAEVVTLCGPPPCRVGDPDDWFDYGTTPDRRAAAVAGCSACPVLAECRAYGLAAGEAYGIWGGTTPAERARIRENVQVRRVSVS